MFKNKKNQFYSLDEIKKQNATYNMIIGERSNGKTYATLSEILKIHVESRYEAQGAIIRRYDDDFKGNRGQTMFASLCDTNAVYEITHGEYDSITYKSKAWYLSRWDEDLEKDIIEQVPFCFAFSLTTMEHDKSTSYPNVRIVLFDEFLTRRAYLPDEFATFMNVLSTIIRHRDDVVIYMLGNTVNKYSPYFKEMGLKKVSEMRPGTIDLYKYGESKLSVAVEMCNTFTKSSKPSDKYFAFDNPKLQMITNGAWEVDIYPHKPVPFTSKDVLLYYFIIFEDTILQCEIVLVDNTMFTYVHQKTTPIKNPEKDIVYSQEHNHYGNWSRRITHPKNKIEVKIATFFKEEKVFYQDNETGEIMRNYVQWCKKTDVI